jgi:hypothetical protein
MEFYVDYLWTKCNIADQKYKIPKYVAGDIKPPVSNLSARALNCASTQACGMVRARVTKLAKTQYVVKREQRKGQPIAKRLVYKLKKPKTNMVLPEMNSL